MGPAVTNSAIVTLKEGVSAKNRDCVLLDVHGGSGLPESREVYDEISGFFDRHFRR
jgi:hypothetical protein